ncbi:MAG: phage terminase large subunit [candidate division Zixibacteria bacterium]|nr:phage terminase large subunit [candidate division Zixibacteria bacterium]
MDFTLYTKGDYETGWFNELLCAELDQFLLDVEAGKSPRLMILAPPRSGKSELASRRFPAYAMAKKPKWNVIATSYASPLADKMSRDTQRIIDDKLYSDVFPNTKLPQKRGGVQRTAEHWETLDAEGELTGASYRAAGVGGGITGQGMNVGIIDDPAKDYKQASSPAYQETVIDWYDTTFYTRRDPKINGIIIILTRWHKKDLAGQLLDRMADGGEQWRVVSFPMEWDSDAPERHTLNGVTYTLRKKCDILFPERMPRPFVDACRASGSLTWNALYQQRPTSKGGSLLKSEWFGEYQVLPKMKYTMVIADTAQKIKERHDFSVFEHWGIGDDGYLYLIDLIRGKWESDELKKRARLFWLKCKSLGNGQCRKMMIEDKSSGTGLIQQLKKSVKPMIPVIPIQRGTDKLTRFMDVQGYIESGYVRLPADAPWLNDFLTECEGITVEFKTHDDQIDPMMDAIDQMLDRKKPNLADWI